MDAMMASQVINWKLPGAGFVIYGIDTEPHMMGDQECIGLDWQSTLFPKPTEADLQVWLVEYQAHVAEQNAIANRDWGKFSKAMFSDHGIVSKAFQTVPNAWYLLIDLLRRPSDSIQSYQLAIKLVRLNMPVDLTNEEIDRLNGYAEDASIPLNVPYTY